MAPTRIKVQEEIWTTELAISCCIFVLCIIGMSVGLSGLSELPKCKFGAPECYFFVQICRDQLLHPNSPACKWIPKTQAIEGTSKGGMEALYLQIFALIIGLVPGLCLIASMIIANERTLFALLEFTRMSCAFDFLLLIIAMMDLNDKTWDCRGYTLLSKGATDCNEGFSLFVTGGVLLLLCEALLLVGSIGIMADERRERSQNRTVFSGGSNAQRIMVG